jgi:Zn-dependent protease
VAYKLGDPTAKLAGRVSLNPLRHLDPLGTLMIFIARFGWGKPTPFNYNNLKHPRRDSALIAIAGPISNLLTAFLIAIAIKYVPTMPEFVYRAIGTIFDLSIILFLFNLLPIAPLDGSKLLGLVIPLSREDWYLRYMSQGPIILIVIVFGDRLLAETTGFSFMGIFFMYGYDLTRSLILLAT